MYRSNFPGTLTPTGSTFNNYTTSRPKVNGRNWSHCDFYR